MGYDQYPVPDTVAVTVHGLLWHSSNNFEEQWTQNYPAEYLSGLSRALFLTTFLKIAVNSDYFGSSAK